MEANESVTVDDQWGSMNPVQLGTTTLANLSSQRSTIEGVLAILDWTTECLGDVPSGGGTG